MKGRLAVGIQPSRGAGSTAYRSKRQVSAGGVIVRQVRGGTRVCLIARRRDGIVTWGLPKGHVEAGENLLAAATRELREETGLTGEHLAPLGSISYWFAVRGDRVRYFKTVHFYVFRYRSGETDQHDDEVEEAVWLPLDEAMARISYENERRILRHAKRYLTRTCFKTSPGLRARG